MSAKIGQPVPGEFLLYETEGGRVRVECRFAEDTLWLSQGLMAELFQTSKQNIAKHLRAIFAEGELSRDSVVNQWLTTAGDGKACRVRLLRAVQSFCIYRCQIELRKFAVVLLAMRRMEGLEA